MSLIFDPKSIFGTGQENEWLEGEVDGVLADFLVVGEGKVMRISDHLGWEEASCLVCAGVAAWSGLAIREEDGFDPRCVCQTFKMRRVKSW